MNPQSGTPTRLAAAIALLFAGCFSGVGLDRAIPPEWMDVPSTDRIPAISYEAGILVRRPRSAPESGVRVVPAGDGFALAAGERVLTGGFPAIDSFDVALERKTVVFSAKHGSGFDVGLVALEGSPVSWVPADPADEVAVQWAPRGNKISYVVRAPGGDLVRTVHVPTATQLTVDFPDGLVRAVAWEPRGERFAVSWESASASGRVEEMRYGGEERRMVTAPEVILDVASEPVAGGVVLRPSTMRYGERLPLVVWHASSLREWDDARGRLQRSARIACAIVDREPDAAFWAAVRGLKWVDGGRVWTVGTAAQGGATSIIGDGKIPSGRARSVGNIVRIPPGNVESFASGFIAEQLKGNPARNGVNR